MDMPYIVRLAPEGWAIKQEEKDAAEVSNDIEVQSQDVKGSAKRSAWARLIKSFLVFFSIIVSRIQFS